MFEDFSQPLTRSRVSLGIVRENANREQRALIGWEENLLQRSLVRVLDVVPRMLRLMLHLIQSLCQLSYIFQLSLVVMVYPVLPTDATSVFKVVICPASIPIWPWIPSSLGASALFIAATVAFASADDIVGVTGAIVLSGTDATAAVVDLSVCSCRSCAQCFFDSLEFAELSAPDLRLQVSCCNHGSCADSGSTCEFVVPLSGSDSVEAPNSGSGRVGEHKISCLVAMMLSNWSSLEVLKYFP